MTRLAASPVLADHSLSRLLATRTYYGAIALHVAFVAVVGTAIAMFGVLLPMLESRHNALVDFREQFGDNTPEQADESQFATHVLTPALIFGDAGFTLRNARNAWVAGISATCLFAILHAINTAMPSLSYAHAGFTLAMATVYTVAVTASGALFAVLLVTPAGVNTLAETFFVMAGKTIHGDADSMCYMSAVAFGATLMAGVISVAGLVTLISPGRADLSLAEARAALLSENSAT